MAAGSLARAYDLVLCAGTGAGARCVAFRVSIDATGVIVIAPRTAPHDAGVRLPAGASATALLRALGELLAASA